MEILFPIKNVNGNLAKAQTITFLFCFSKEPSEPHIFYIFTHAALPCFTQRRWVLHSHIRMLRKNDGLSICLICIENFIYQCNTRPTENISGKFKYIFSSSTIFLTNSKFDVTQIQAFTLLK